ncbi:MAG: ChbG/HpnK family deacetylase [Sphingobacteriales bacterium]|nr:ChbG/HpnK family deacetylase [Sphingobacteriales bacterium]
MDFFFHADDAGAGRQATKRIVECWQKGYIEGFSIIANPDCYDIIQQGLSAHPGKKAKLSAHLNLTDGICINAASANTVLALKNKKFRLTFYKALLLMLKKKQFIKELEELVFNEWDAQIKSINQMLGERKIDVLDSHNYVHMLPPFFKAMTRLSEKYKIRKIRFAKELFVVGNWLDVIKPFFWINLVKCFLLNWLYKLNKPLLLYPKPNADLITGVLYSGNMTAKTIKNAIALAKKRKANSLEIVYHPGRAIPEEMVKWALTKSATKFFISQSRDDEYETAKIIKNECSEYFGG